MVLWRVLFWVPSWVWLEGTPKGNPPLLSASDFHILPDLEGYTGMSYEGHWSATCNLPWATSDNMLDRYSGMIKHTQPGPEKSSNATKGLKMAQVLCDSCSIEPSIEHLACKLKCQSLRQLPIPTYPQEPHHPPPQGEASWGDLPPLRSRNLQKPPLHGGYDGNLAIFEGSRTPLHDVELEKQPVTKADALACQQVAIANTWHFRMQPSAKGHL